MCCKSMIQVAIITVAGAFAAPSLADKAQDRRDARWDSILRGISINQARAESAIGVEPKDNRSKRLDHAPAIKDKNENTYSSSNKRQLTTKSSTTHEPPKGKATPIIMPTKPIGLRLIYLTKGIPYQDKIHDKLRIKMDLHNKSHTNYLMSFLAQKHQEGWTWEQKQRSQNVSRSNRADTELDIHLSRPIENDTPTTR